MSRDSLKNRRRLTLSEPEEFKKHKPWDHCRICGELVPIRVGEEVAKYRLCRTCKGKIAKSLEKFEELEKELGSEHYDI